MNYTQHPLSAAWPAMQADEYQALKDSIELIGVQNPITLLEGMVIDGWHRYSVAIELGVECPTKELGNIDPIDFVKSQNEARRNVTASQRALAITTIYAWKPANIGRPAIISRDEPGSPLAKTNAELAEIANTTVRTIQQAKAVQANATPEVKAAVKAGTMSVKKAAETTKPPKPEAKPAPAVVEPEAVDPPEYTELDAAQDLISELQSELVISRMGDIPEEQKQQAAERIADLQAENKTLTATLKAVTLARDSLMEEVVQMKRQMAMQRKEIDKLKNNR